MKRLLIVLVASLVLGLVGGVGSAFAGDLIPSPSDVGTDGRRPPSRTTARTAPPKALLRSRR